MSIGERRHRVTFQRASMPKDDFGEPGAEWSNLCVSWGLVQPLKGAEKFSAMQVTADVDHRIVTRSRSELDGLRPGDRATWNGHTYDIRSVLFRDHRASELEIMAQEHIT